MRSTSRRWFAVLTLLAAACTAPKEQDAARSADAAGTVAVEEPVEDLQDAAELQAAFAAAKAREQGLTFDALEARHSPAFLPKHGLDLKKAAHYEQFAKAFKLSDAERAKLDELGFVVIPAREQGGAGPVDLYYRVFAADLPVFVSADSVLHAWHRSYDSILEETEATTLTEHMTGLLESVDKAIDAVAYTIES